MRCSQLHIQVVIIHKKKKLNLHLPPINDKVLTVVTHVKMFFLIIVIVIAMLTLADIVTSMLNCLCFSCLSTGWRCPTKRIGINVD